MADGTLISTKSFYGRTVKTDIVENQHIRNPVVLEPGSSEKESSDEEDELDLFPSSGSEYQRSEEELSESELYMSEIEADMSNEVLGEQQASAKTQIPGSVTGINLQQSSVKSKSKEKNIQEMKTRWRKRTSPKFDVNFKGQELPPPPNEALNPVDYFKQFFSEDLIQHIAEQTNLYSVQQTGASIQTSKSEMEQYIGILIMMSIIKLPQIRMYWANETRVSSISEVMTGKRFEILKKNFHCNDNTKYVPAEKEGHDKLFKVRPVVDSVLQKCRSIPQEEKQSIDEQMIPTKGRTSFKQYCPKKPHKWGIKVWARCGVSGLVYDFEVYSGKCNDKEEMPELLMAGNVVRRLCDTLPHNMNHKIYFDNYFSSLPLLQHLTKKKIWVVATVRKDRMKGAQHHLQSEKELKRNGRGSSDSVVEANSGITVVRWMDNGIVQLISNYMSGEDGPAARRWCEKEREYVQIERPLIIHEYNIHMGGVDLCDMLLSLYRIGHKSVKYYMHIVFYCIGISIVNAWLLYRRHSGQMDIPKKKQLTLLKFQAQIGHSLANAGKICKLKRGRPSNDVLEVPCKQRRPPSVVTPTIDICKDKVDHFPEFHEKQNRCRHCKTGFSHVMCTKCKVYLCLVKKRNCFADFH